MAQRLKDKVAIITGGGSGIGKAIAKCYVTEGAEGGARGPQQGQHGRHREGTHGHGAGSPRRSSATSPRSSRSSIWSPRPSKTFGRIDILVNNSGIGGPTANVVDLTLEGWNEILAVDLTGSMLCAARITEAYDSRQERHHHQYRRRRRPYRRRAVRLSNACRLLLRQDGRNRPDRGPWPRRSASTTFASTA